MRLKTFLLVLLASAILASSAQASYPNWPDTTLITWEGVSNAIPLDSRITLVLYDQSGRQVQEVYNGFNQAGDYQLTLDASAIPSGVYFVKMNAPQFSSTSKLEVLR